ncbi:MAG TPA: hypothetical protein VE869_05940 [Gemmatimonas sp.]|nr:hypothetical protein [Gemmatimonas sp.]
MAEINIEKKQRSVLPWLLAGLLVLGLLWFLFARNTGGDVATGRADSAYRDTSAAAGTLAPADSMGTMRGDTTGAGSTGTVPPPR